MSSSPYRNSDQSRPAWQLPAGVSRGAWDYVTEPSIASEYDRFHAGHPLLDLDCELISRHLGMHSDRLDGTPRIAIDFGCGTGRSLIPLAEKGWRVVGVDLSSEMLKKFRAKTNDLTCQKPATIRANMAKLECFSDDFADAILCMYSSLGMVQGRENRRSFMKHVQRILCRDGRFIVHVHNRGSWLRDPEGIRRTIKDWLRAKRDKTWELGDSIYAYRGLPSMYLHIYSEAELRKDLRICGLKIEQFYRLNRQSSQFLGRTWFPHLRSGGFIAVCVRG